MPAFEWVHVQLHQQKGMISLSPPTICNSAHMPDLAPTREMFERYKLQKGDWEIYSSDFIDLITKRHIESLEKSQFADACLLCSEHKPHHCHRRLVAEYLADKWPDVTIMHL
ncbi:DUF488 family protein, N3 subclade [Escherichia coli]